MIRDLVKRILEIYGIKAIFVVVIAGIGIWFVAHLNAAPGSGVSVLWGLVEYTKKQDVSIGISHSKNSIHKNIESVKKNDLSPITLFVEYNVTQDNYVSTLKSLRSKNNLRELSSIESNTPVLNLPKGTYFFLLYSWIDFYPEGALDTINRLDGARYKRYEDSDFEFHYYENNTISIIGFTLEADASRVTTLDGKSSHQILLTTIPTTKMSSLIAIPINRIVEASPRELQQSKDESINVLDVILQ